MLADKICVSTMVIEAATDNLLNLALVKVDTGTKQGHGSLTIGIFLCFMMQSIPENRFMVIG